MSDVSYGPAPDSGRPTGQRGAHDPGQSPGWVEETEAKTRSGKPTSAARYAVTMFGTSIPINMANTLATFFYVDVMGLQASMFAAVLGTYAIIDAIDNPIYGYLSDRTRTRFGRRKPWILAATPVLVVGLFCLFSPPDAMSVTALVVWFGIFTVLTGTADSMVNANYGALLPELFRNEKRRALANGLRQGFQLIAMIISVALSPMLVDQFGYGPVAVAFGVIALAVISFGALGAREDPAALTAERPRIFATIKAMGTNPKFWLTALTSGAYSSGMALVLATVTFFVTYTLGLPTGHTTYLLASVIGASVLFLTLWTFLVRRFGPELIWRIALITLALALGSLSFAQTLSTAIACGMFVGLGYSGVMATMDLIMGRLLDEDTARTGQRREGMFLSAFGFFNRLNALFIALAFLLVENIFGYSSGDSPGERPHEAARFLISHMPAIAVAVAAALSWLVRFDRPAISDATPVASAATGEAITSVPQGSERGEVGSVGHMGAEEPDDDGVPASSSGSPK